MSRQIKHRIEITEERFEDDDSDFYYTIERQSQRDPTDWTVLETGAALSTTDAADRARISLERLLAE